MHAHRSTTLVLALAGCLAAASAPASAGGNNLLENSKFEEQSGPSSTVTSVGEFFLGESVAKHWFVFHNTPATTTTSLVPSTIFPGGTMLKVKTTGGSNGVEQILGATGTGPACVKHGAWIYIESGAVLIGAGNGGSTGVDVIVDTQREWKFIETDNTTCPVNLMVIYSWGGPAEFYVDNAFLIPFNCVGPPGDIDQDGKVGASDLSILLGSWGACNGAPCAADIDGNTVVNAGDLAVLLANWGC